MNDVVEEEAENGYGDSVGHALECAELDECLEEMLRDRLQVLVKEEGPEVSDCENNGILFSVWKVPRRFEFSSKIRSLLISFEDSPTRTVRLS